MNVTAVAGPLVELDVDAIVVGVAEDGALAAPVAELNEAMQGVLTRLVEAREITGRLGDVTVLLEPTGTRTRTLAVTGLGKSAAIDRGAYFRAAGSAAKALAKRQRGKVAFCFGPDVTGEGVESGVVGAMVGCHGQDLYRTEKKFFPFTELQWWGAAPEVLHRGEIIGESVNLARRLVNHPPNVIYPNAFAEIAEQVCEETGIECEAWDEARLETERCGALLAVGRGSVHPPRLLIMRYRGTDEEQAPLVLAGKGVTFDSGGLSIKPTDGMKTMKGDMAGAATVLATLRAIACLGLPVHVVGLVGLVENMISGSAYKVGDILTARNGKTIEVLNTDAEGRLVLADVLDVALDAEPGALIDLATLTGACVVALGTSVAGLMTNHQAWCDSVVGAARACGEAVWQLPMFPEYGEQIRSSVADIKNVGEGRYGGAITAAKFLEEFVGGKPWVHIDIAGPSFLESARAWMDGGGTGAYVRTLVELARQWTGSAPGADTATPQPV